MNQLYIADDNTEFASYIAEVSRQQGWAVTVCGNGRELLQHVSTGKGPALLLVDINMPEMDGIEAIEGLAQIERVLRIRFMTGGADTSILAAKLIAKARSLVVGRNMFKPVSKSTLVSVLTQEAGELQG